MVKGVAKNHTRKVKIRSCDRYELEAWPRVASLRVKRHSIADSM